MSRPKFEGETKEERLLSAAKQVRYDMLSRGKRGSDGCIVVDMSSSVWRNLCNTLDEFKRKKP